jgi:hypothetical protein
MFKSKQRSNDENLIINERHTDICTEFNNDQKKAILKQLSELGNLLR